MKIISLLFCIVLLLLFTVSSAQYYETGQDPASLKWMQIKTGKFTVIYPRDYGQGGIEFARSLENAWSKLTAFYPDKRFRIPVIIHNHTTQSNGYVAWAPRRMEVYPTPDQNSIPLDPNEQLAIHELTHVFQMESLNKGFTKVFSVLLGEQMPGFVSSLLPFWYLEGDAVFNESALTGSGRGRSPSFQKQLKAITVEKGGMYKYDKIVNGSFRDFVPDHYESGYQMLTWSKVKYDPQLWNRVLNYTANLPFTINPVNLSLSKNASLTKKRLYRETFDTLKNIWISDDSRSESETYEILNPEKGNKYINYHSPLIAGPDSIIAVKTSLSKPPSFVLISPRKKTEERIFIPGRIYPWFISYAKGNIVWVETRRDPRWENRNWSVIMIMDIHTSQKKQLTRKTRFMSASISPDGNFIAAVENTIENKNNLVFIDATTGYILNTAPVPDNVSLQRPQWDASGKQVSVIFLTAQGEGIMSYSLTDNTWRTLIDAGRDDLQSTFVRNDSLFFISSASGTDNIYLRTPDKSVKPLTRSRFGVSDLIVNDYTMLFADYSSSGNNICYTILSTAAIETDVNSSSSSFLINKYNRTIPSDVSDPHQVYTQKPYRKWQHLFKFHSWMPFYADIEEIQTDPASIKPGFTLMTQNNLSTLISSLGYEYSENRHKLHSRLKWQGWYLVFESQVNYGHTPEIQKFRQTVADPVEIREGLQMTNSVSLPLTFSSGRFSQYLYFSGSSVYHNNYIYIKEDGMYDPGQTQLTGRLYFSNYQRSAHRDIYPRWAQVIDLSYSSYPFDKKLYGNISTARTAFFFPGFLPNNGIKIRLEYEEQNPEKFILGNRTSFSRSFENIISKKVEFLSVDYFMPLVYPDFNIASLLYLTRIRTNFFYDFTRGTGNYIFSVTDQGDTTDYHDYTETFKSFGLELMSDFYLFRIPFMISTGVQASWRSFGSYPYLGLLFNIDIFGMNIGKSKL